MAEDAGPARAHRRGPQATSAPSVRKAERERQAIALRLGGANYATIAAELGVAESSAYRYVRGAMDRARKEATEGAHHIMQLELERLDRLQAAYWPAAIGSAEGEGGAAAAPDAKAAEMCLKIMERRIRLMGLERAGLSPAGPDSAAADVSDARDKLLQTLAHQRAARGPGTGDK